MESISYPLLGEENAKINDSLKNIERIKAENINKNRLHNNNSVVIISSDNNQKKKNNQIRIYDDIGNTLITKSSDAGNLDGESRFCGINSGNLNLNSAEKIGSSEGPYNGVVCDETGRSTNLIIKEPVLEDKDNEGIEIADVTNKLDCVEVNECPKGNESMNFEKFSIEGVTKIESKVTGLEKSSNELNLQSCLSVGYSGEKNETADLFMIETPEKVEKGIKKISTNFDKDNFELIECPKRNKSIEIDKLSIEDGLEEKGVTEETTKMETKVDVELVSEKSSNNESNYLKSCFIDKDSNTEINQISGKDIVGSDKKYASQDNPGKTSSKISPLLHKRSEIDRLGLEHLERIYNTPPNVESISKCSDDLLNAEINKNSEENNKSHVGTDKKSDNILKETSSQIKQLMNQNVEDNFGSGTDTDREWSSYELLDDNQSKMSPKTLIRDSVRSGRDLDQEYSTKCNVLEETALQISKKSEVVDALSQINPLNSQKILEVDGGSSETDSVQKCSSKCNYSLEETATEMNTLISQKLEVVDKINDENISNSIVSSDKNVEQNCNTQTRSVASKIEPKPRRICRRASTIKSKLNEEISESDKLISNTRTGSIEQKSLSSKIFQRKSCLMLRNRIKTEVVLEGNEGAESNEEREQKTTDQLIFSEDLSTKQPPKQRRKARPFRTQEASSVFDYEKETLNDTELVKSEDHIQSNEEMLQIHTASSSKALVSQISQSERKRRRRRNAKESKLVEVGDKKYTLNDTKLVLAKLEQHLEVQLQIKGKTSSEAIVSQISQNKGKRKRRYVEEIKFDEVCDKNDALIDTKLDQPEDLLQTNEPTLQIHTASSSKAMISQITQNKRKRKRRNAEERKLDEVCDRAITLNDTKLEQLEDLLQTNEQTLQINTAGSSKGMISQITQNKRKRRNGKLDEVCDRAFTLNDTKLEQLEDLLQTNEEMLQIRRAGASKDVLSLSKRKRRRGNTQERKLDTERVDSSKTGTIQTRGKSFKKMIVPEVGGNILDCGGEKLFEGSVNLPEDLSINKLIRKENNMRSTRNLRKKPVQEDNLKIYNNLHKKRKIHNKDEPIDLSCAKKNVIPIIRPQRNRSCKQKQNGVESLGEYPKVTATLKTAVPKNPKTPKNDQGAAQQLEVPGGAKIRLRSDLMQPVMRHERMTATLQESQTNNGLKMIIRKEPNQNFQETSFYDTYEEGLYVHGNKTHKIRYIVRHEQIKQETPESEEGKEEGEEAGTANEIGGDTTSEAMLLPVKEEPFSFMPMATHRRRHFSASGLRKAPFTLTYSSAIPICAVLHEEVILEDDSSRIEEQNAANCANQINQNATNSRNQNIPNYTNSTNQNIPNYTNSTNQIVPEVETNTITSRQTNNLPRPKLRGRRSRKIRYPIPQNCDVTKLITERRKITNNNVHNYTINKLNDDSKSSEQQLDDDIDADNSVNQNNEVSNFNGTIIKSELSSERFDDENNADDSINQNNDVNNFNSTIIKSELSSQRSDDYNNADDSGSRCLSENQNNFNCAIEDNTFGGISDDIIRTVTSLLPSDPGFQSFEDEVKVKSRKPRRRRSEMNHIPASLKCEFCFRVLKTKQSYEHHISKHVDPKKQRVKCGYCRKVLASERRLKSHIFTHHTFTKTFLCEMCNKIFHDKGNLYKHVINTHLSLHKYTCSVCEKSFKKKSYLRHHLDMHLGIRRYKCEICAKNFMNRTDLQNHLDSHAGFNRYTCAICGKALYNARTLRTHMKCHTRENLHKCQFCEKAYVSKSSLNQHLNVHTGKQYKCDVCSAVFPYRNGYNRHIKIHEGKQQECDICHKRFQRKCYLKKHMTIHLGTEKFQCPYCVKRFIDKSDFDKHVNCHTHALKFTCDFCSKEFHSKAYLAVHLRIHTGSKHVCKYCGKNFMKKNLLQRHESIHEGTNFVTCDVCGLMLSSSASCKRHLWFIHGIDRYCS